MSNIKEVLLQCQKKYGDSLTLITIELIASFVIKKDRVFLFAHPEFGVGPEDIAIIMQLLAQAKNGKPLAYITGEKEFFGLAFSVDEGVLVPRPETEGLVELMLDWVNANANPSCDLLDLGTGSGAIAISLAVKLPQCHITAADSSEAALQIARENAARHQVSDRTNLLCSDMFSQLSGTFAGIVANLPYIDTNELLHLEVSKWEPLTALNGGVLGLELFERFFLEAPKFIKRPGFIALEIGWEQRQAVTALAKQAFPDAEIMTHKDFASLDRIITITLY